MALYKHSLNNKLNIGKYKYYKLQDVIDINAPYVEWLRNNAKNNFEIDSISEAYLVDKLALFAIKKMNKHLNNLNKI